MLNIMRIRNKILAVDDDAVDVMVLKKILDQEFELKTTSTGEQALEIARDFQPDIILLDNVLPGISGREVCQQMRADSRLRHAKIIMVSGKTMISERIEAYGAGADDYVTKPFDKEELLAKIRVYLRLKSVEEVDQFKTNILALLSHEMRTPLTSLIGSAEILMSEENIDAKEQKMFVEFVHSGAKRLHDFFEKIIMLGSLKSGKRSFNMVQANLCEILRGAISEVTSKASNRNIKIEEIFDINPIVCVDKTEIKNIVVMILDNAIRFSPSDEIIKVCVSSENEDVCIKVIDNGSGIDPDYLPYVFEELSDPDVAHHSEGHGLSLAIARQIVLRHNGNISVESTKSSGTTFKVQLPVAVSSELVNCEG